MTIVRLSKVESGGSSNTSLHKEPTTSNSTSIPTFESIETIWPASRARTTRYASRFVAFTLLTLSALFILLSLLLPTYKQGLSVFTIKPVGHQWIANDGHATGSVDLPEPTPSLITYTKAARGFDSEHTEERRESRRSRSITNRASPVDKEQDKDARKSLYPEGGDGKVIWFGLDGPTVWVGTMQICSKSDWHAETVCTSASRAAYHVRDLPLSLGDALLALPQKPIAPILLLITAIATLPAILIYTMPLMIRSIGSWKGCSGRPWARQTKNSESSADLVKPGIGEDESTHMPHHTFLVLMSIAVVLGIATAAVEGNAIRSAHRAWDKETGDEIGMVFKSAGIAAMLPIIPILLILATLSAYTPLLIHLFARFFLARRQANAPPSPPLQEHGADIIHRAEISDLFAETVADSGKRTSRGSIIFSEISPKSPPVSVWSRMSGRRPTIHGAPGEEEHEPMPTNRQSSWMTDRTGVDRGDGLVEDIRDSKRTDPVDEERDEKSESWGTFGVGQAV